MEGGVRSCEPGTAVEGDFSPCELPGGGTDVECGFGPCEPRGGAAVEGGFCFVPCEPGVGTECVFTLEVSLLLVATSPVLLLHEEQHILQHDLGASRFESFQVFRLNLSFLLGRACPVAIMYLVVELANIIIAGYQC